MSKRQLLQPSCMNQIHLLKPELYQRPFGLIQLNARHNWNDSAYFDKLGASAARALPRRAPDDYWILSRYFFNNPNHTAF